MMIVRIILVIIDMILAGICVLGMDEYGEDCDRAFAFAVSIALMLNAIAILFCS